MFCFQDITEPKPPPSVKATAYKIVKYNRQIQVQITIVSNRPTTEIEYAKCKHISFKA